MTRSFIGLTPKTELGAFQQPLLNVDEEVLLLLYCAPPFAGLAHLVGRYHVTLASARCARHLYLLHKDAHLLHAHLTTTAIATRALTPLLAALAAAGAAKGISGEDDAPVGPIVELLEGKLELISGVRRPGPPPLVPAAWSETEHVAEEVKWVHSRLWTSPAALLRSFQTRFAVSVVDLALLRIGENLVGARDLLESSLVATPV